MLNPNYIILYVANAPASGKFYANLLGRDPVENSETFVMFALDSGVMLGLWARRDVKPDTGAATGANSELCFKVNDRAAVDKRHADWKRAGLPVIQERTTMDFGYTFTAADPDGHRLRVFAPTA